MDRDRIQLAGQLGTGQQRFKLGREKKSLLKSRVIKRLDAASVTHHQQPPTPAVPEGEGKDAVQSGGHFIAAFFIQMQQHFGIRGTAKGVTGVDQFPAKFGEVVDLAVKGQPEGAILVGHGLPAISR